ncbi:unnamed protein product, partial [Effrenium voratum]
MTTMAAPVVGAAQLFESGDLNILLRPIRTFEGPDFKKLQRKVGRGKVPAHAAKAQLKLRAWHSEDWAGNIRRRLGVPAGQWSAKSER